MNKLTDEEFLARANSVQQAVQRYAHVDFSALALDGAARHQAAVQGASLAFATWRETQPWFVRMGVADPTRKIAQVSGSDYPELLQVSRRDMRAAWEQLADRRAGILPAWHFIVAVKSHQALRVCVGAARQASQQVEPS